MRLTKAGTPVSSTDGQNTQLGDYDGGSDSSSHLLGSLDAETDVALRVANDHDGLEASTLTGTGLLLNGFDLDRLLAYRGYSKKKKKKTHTFITSSFNLGRK